ncbi:TadE/TadG family type IV pilus assembly protein [Sinomonas sp. R1AF57]|uniref:TadE/TadG family type IV pilus assembly protein n=1 Tax=Sinomonas sp. R1AF57 TaxID=2020377 RepID=UPI000B5DC4A9|nr:TadE family protein [Sinomonas sp. R1AF57]ASN52361.1 pilus assembly protein TadE [Sinomonas sp. R1AF57]
MRSPRSRRPWQAPWGSDEGSAAADFVMVGGLLTVLALAVVQLTLVLHVRNVLVDAAASGARYGTLADRTPQDARTRAGELITGAVGADYAGDISVGHAVSAGVRSLEVRVVAPMPVVGLIGPVGHLKVSGHAPLQ